MQDNSHPDLRPQVDQYLSLFGQGKIDDMLQRMPLPAAAAATSSRTCGPSSPPSSAPPAATPASTSSASSPCPRATARSTSSAYFEKEPALFQFGFYRPNNEWQVQHFRLRTDFAQFLDLLPVQRP